MLERSSGERLPEPAVRLTDTDRHAAVEALRHHCGEGILTLDEFGDRVTLVYDSKTRAELEDVLSDLPHKETEVPEAKRRRVKRWAVAIMGGHTPRGRFRLAETTNVVAIMGGVELDLRNAEIDGDEVVINCVSLMGSIEIYVPEGISVDFSGLPLLGGTECKIADVPVIPGSPRIIVRGLAIMGGVEVHSRKTPTQEKALNAAKRADRAELLRTKAIESTERAAAKLERHASRLRETVVSSRPIAPRPQVSISRPTSGTAGLAIVRVAESVARDWESLAAQAAPEGTVTVLFSEVVDYPDIARRTGESEVAELLRRHDDLVAEVVKEHGGFTVRNDGEAFLVAFGGASRAMRCAKAIQRAIDVEELAASGDPIRLRLGLHAGEAEDGASAHFLDQVVLGGAGIACQAEAGEILVSGLLRDLAAPTGEFSFGQIRELRLGDEGQLQTVVPLAWQ